MVDFHNTTVFGVDTITIRKGEGKEGQRWVTIDFGGGSSVTVFKNPAAAEWPEVVVDGEHLKFVKCDFAEAVLAGEMSAFEIG
jgi:hypothetical protein